MSASASRPAFPGRLRPGDVGLAAPVGGGQLGADVARSQGLGPLVGADLRLELAPAHGPQQGLLAGQLQGHHRGVEGLAQLRLAAGTGPIACAGSVIPAASR